ncbi:MAG: hypothetical protein ACM31C_07115 [Acidobacteriota bacterium]
MIRHVTLFTILASLLATTACKKKDGGADPAAKTAEAPKAGCGSDFADPEQQFCIKLPPGYKLDKANKEEQNSVRYEFQGPEQYFNVLVWGDPQFTYDYQLGVYGPAMKQADHTDVQAGGTPGQTQWWTYKFGTDKPMVTALAKSPSGMAIQCEGDVPTPAPEVIEACKSLRPYPGGKPRAVPAAGSAAAK